MLLAKFCVPRHCNGWCPLPNSIKPLSNEVCYNFVTCITFPCYNDFRIHFFPPPTPPPFFLSRLTQDSNALLSWELSYLGLKIINSQFVGGGYGLATNESTTFSPRELICQYFGRFLVLTKSQTDELFNPIFFGNHERLILLTSTMQPIVHHHQTKPDTYDQVSFFLYIVEQWCTSR